MFVGTVFDGQTLRLWVSGQTIRKMSMGGVLLADFSKEEQKMFMGRWATFLNSKKRFGGNTREVTAGDAGVGHRPCGLLAPAPPGARHCFLIMGMCVACLGAHLPIGPEVPQRDPHRRGWVAFGWPRREMERGKTGVTKERREP